METHTSTTSFSTPRQLLLYARSGSLRMLAFAGVIVRALEARRHPLIRGLSESEFQALMRHCFPACPPLAEAAPGINSSIEGQHAAVIDEFDDLVALLLEHRAEATQESTWLAYAMASAAMGEDHLWQDMGLPSRAVLSSLIQENFPTLHATNTGNMKWKKFFYRQLCERARVPICKSPHCAECVDYTVCFGPES